jgi:hypothetical protein
MKIFCDECNKIMWPKTAKMTVTPNEEKKAEGQKTKVFHFSCWMQIAPKDALYEFSKAFQQRERNRNE